MIQPWKKSTVSLLLTAFIAISVTTAGCGNKDQTADNSEKTEVKAMQPISYTRPMSIEFVAQIKSIGEIMVRPNVSGTVVEKFITGGEMVTEGQPLYQLDSSKYEASADKAYADLVAAQVKLENAQIDLARYMELAKTGDISEQTVATQQSNVTAFQAAVEANEAVLQKAVEDYNDTTVYAPMSGQLSIDNVSVGTYAIAGATDMVSMGAPDPIYAQFSVPESVYLESIAMDIDHLPVPTLTLGEKEPYPFEGRLVEADRSIQKETGNLTIKALFPNPDGLLMPGMFTRIKLTNPQITGKEILIPQRAVQQLLDKSHVLVVGEDNKSVTKVVKLGEKVGDYYIVEDGLNPEDIVIVEGLTNLLGGKELSVTMVTPEEMGYSTEKKPETDS